MWVTEEWQWDTYLFKISYDNANIISGFFWTILIVNQEITYSLYLNNMPDFRDSSWLSHGNREQGRFQFSSRRHFSIRVFQIGNINSIIMLIIIYVLWQIFILIFYECRSYRVFQPKFFNCSVFLFQYKNIKLIFYLHIHYIKQAHNIIKL